MIAWTRFHLPRRYLLCYSVSLFLLFGLGLLFPSSSASAAPLSNVSLYRTLVYTTGAGSSPSTMNDAYFNSFSVGENVELVGTASPFVAVQGFRAVVNGTFGNSAYKYNVLTLTVALKQVSNASNQNTLRQTQAGFRAKVNGSYVVGSCDTGVLKDLGTNQHRMDWTCSVRLPEASSASTLEFSVGSSVASTTNYPTTSLASVGVYNTLFTASYWNSNPLYFSSNLVTDSTNDASVGILEQQTGIMNQQLAEQQETNDLLQQQIDAQHQANDQQQEQYEAEKEAESEREDEQSASADEMSGLFNFSVLNPFAGIFALFSTGSSCVNIPTLSNWLHTEQTQVCPFFPSKVLTIVTPVLGISSMMLLFGFFVRWLNGSSGDHGITVKGGLN